ncbi:hypothetical protein DFH29DRAFT_879397 [Suillus ampliporus]|nr:hypothetical protein DFH29DRAFT_879397 [Suillus ampliporus]
MQSFSMMMAKRMQVHAVLELYPYISFHILHLMGDGLLVKHMPCNDLESLFYILLEFTVMYLGPKGELAPRPSEEALRWDAVRRWGLAYESMTHDGLATSSMWKREFIHGLADPPLITPYFILCCPLLERVALCDFSHKYPVNYAVAQYNLQYSNARELAQIPPPAPPSVPEPTITPSPPLASTSQPVAVSQTVPPVPPSVSASMPTVTQSLPDLPLAVHRPCHSKPAGVKY